MKYDDFKRELKNKCGVHSTKLDILYNEADSRCWSAVIGKDSENLMVTFHINRGDLGNKNFDLLGSNKQLIEVPEWNIYSTISSLVKTELL